MTGGWKRYALLVAALLVFASRQVSASTPPSVRFSIGIKYTGLSIHLKKSVSPQLYRHNLDKGGYVVFTHGLALNFEYHIYDDLALRVTQGMMFFDCAGKFHGATQIGLSHGYRPAQSAHEIRLAAGPIFFYRKSWKSFPSYIDDGLFKESKNGIWQTKFVWHGGEIEYNYWYQDQAAFSLNWLPGVPEIFMFSPGIKYRSLRS